MARIFTLDSSDQNGQLMRRDDRLAGSRYRKKVKASEAWTEGDGDRNGGR